jgi:molybdenum cofactor cytidylyltransferase
MVARVVDAVLGAPVRPIIVVTWHEASAVRTSLAGRDVTFVHNPDFADGMATSIRAGVAALPEEASAVVICLGDMPALASEDIARLLAAFETGGADICVPVAGERRGNPALFARRFFPELQVLSGDTGARGLIAAHADQVREVRMEGVGILTDLDTEADIDAYNRTQNQ